MSKEICPVDLIVDAFNQREMHFVDLAKKLFESGVKSSDLSSVSQDVPAGYLNDLFNLLWHLERKDGLFDVHAKIAKRGTISATRRIKMKTKFGETHHK